MNCPNCDADYPIRTGVKYKPDGDEHEYKCPYCRYRWWTVERIKEQQERQAFQVYLWSAICNHHEDESRREEDNASLGYRSTTGGSSDSAPGTVTGNGAAADGASGAGS